MNKKDKTAAARASPSKLVSVAGQLGALIAASLALGACSKTPTEPPTPVMQPVQEAPASRAPDATDPSVPAAASVVAPAVQAKPAPDGGRTNSSMSSAQESSRMPMPGQNNDHSAPLGPAKPASGP